MNNITEITVFEEDIPYLLVVSYEDSKIFLKFPLSSNLYVRVHDDQRNFLFGTWVELLKRNSCEELIANRARKLFSSSMLKTCIDFAERVEKMKVFL